MDKRIVNVQIRSTGKFVMEVDPRTRQVTDKKKSFVLLKTGHLIPSSKPATETLIVKAWSV